MHAEKQLWEGWFEKYRGSELAELVIHLARIALARGEVTAEDAHCIPVINPNIRGAAMRTLRRMGITVTKGPEGHTSSPQPRCR